MQFSRSETEFGGNIDRFHLSNFSASLRIQSPLIGQISDSLDSSKYSRALRHSDGQARRESRDRRAGSGGSKREKATMLAVIGPRQKYARARARDIGTGRRSSLFTT